MTTGRISAPDPLKGSSQAQWLGCLFPLLLIVHNKNAPCHDNRTHKRMKKTPILPHPLKGL